MFKLLFVLPLIALADPFLLYWMWPSLSFGVQIGMLIVFPLAVTFYTRSRPIADGELFTRPIRFATRVAAWYPGPMSKILALLMVIPSVERLVIRLATERFQQHILRGINTGVPTAQPAPKPFSKASLPNDDKLKRARGRVIE